MNQKDIFNLAWQIAKEAAFHFDCGSRVFFDEALKQANAMSKTHCRIEKKQWHFDTINGHILITTPKGKEIKITNYIVRTRTQHAKFILGLAKKTIAFLTEDEIAILTNLSTVKF